MQELARQIETYRVDVQRFFGGDLQIPPEDLRERILASIRRLRSGAQRGGTAETFRLNTLEAKFNSLIDLFNRRRRQRELGGGRRSAAPAPQLDPERGVVVGQNSQANAVEALYQRLYLASGDRSPTMDLERFRSYLDRQVTAIRQKTGCADIQFRVAREGDKLKLKARPLRDAAGSS
ncbi:MAG: MXAN_5187 C-terminal domain-containing protein [Acidobacteriota bacterium]